jgi:hypothetical protein
MAATAVAVAALAMACGGDDKDDFAASSDPARAIPRSDLKPVNVVVAGGEWIVGKNNFVIGITDKADEPQGGASVTMTFYDLSDPAKPKPVSQGQALESAPGVGEIVEHTHASGEVHQHGGEDDGRVGYYINVEFDHAGLWGVAVEAKLKDGTTGRSNVSFEVLAAPRIPAPGKPAPKSANLTKADVAKISEIDSGDPPNDMHDVRIKDSIAAGRPLVIVFATPAFCSSRFCGPVVEEVESLHEDYGDRVDFVHIEIWRDFAAKQLNPTAKEWLQRADGGLSEPFVYIVDSKGVIYDRFEGPSARVVLEPAVKAVAEGKTYGAN